MTSAEHTTGPSTDDSSTTPVDVIRPGRPIEFLSGEQILLRGWLRLPAGSGPHPLVILAHGFGGLHTWHLPNIAATFVESGFAALAFDYRNFGESDGTPREEVDAPGQIVDWQSAITFATTLDEIDANRIGIWGTSHGGKNVLIVAAFDRRVRCVVAQCPAIDWGETVLLHQNNADQRQELMTALDEDRLTRFAGGEPTYVNLDVVGAGPRFLESLSPNDRRTWPGRLTLRSYEPTVASNARPFMHMIAPTPLLMIVADADITAPLPMALEAYAAAREPKSLFYISGGHEDVYFSPLLDTASEAAAEWFKRHLA